MRTVRIQLLVSVLSLGAGFFVAPARAAELTLNADKNCYSTIDATVTVTVDLTNAGAVIVGGQFFLQYDQSLLDFVSIEPGDPPFVNEIVEFVPGDDGPGTIDYSVGIVAGGTGSVDDSTMAVITFTALAEACSIADLVSFRSHALPTKISDEVGDGVDTTLVDLSSISTDAVSPTTTCPPNTAVVIGDSTDPSATGEALATDNCDIGAITVTYSDSHPPPPTECPALDIITRTWTSADACDHSDSCIQTIEVIDADSDGDGTVDCADGCPDDPDKIDPGVCGCGVPDTDSDSDTIPNCHDQCPGEDDLIDDNEDGVPDCAEGAIPTLSEWGLVLMAVLLCGVARFYFGGRKAKA